MTDGPFSEFHVNGLQENSSPDVIALSREPTADLKENKTLRKPIKIYRPIHLTKIIHPLLHERRIYQMKN